MLTTLQYLIVDEILLARVMEQKKPVYQGYRDEVLSEDDTDEDLDEETEYDARKGRPILA